MKQSSSTRPRPQTSDIGLSLPTIKTVMMGAKDVRVMGRWTALDPTPRTHTVYVKVKMAE